MKRIWFITGISSGFGAALAEEAIAIGDFVIGTFRKQEQVDAFNSQYEGKAFALKLDVDSTSEIAEAFDIIRNQYGRIDVLVNNAGFGYAGAIEETPLQDVRDLFETNFFGLIQVTHHALPMMRAQGSGHIIQMSSGAGVKATPGFGFYNATKFAVEGYSEALAGELAPLGIKVTLVEPGPFRTNFASSSFRDSGINIPDYDQTSGLFRNRMKQISGSQEGDPVKGAKAIVDVVRHPNPPMRLPLGTMAVANINLKLEQVKKDVDDWYEVAMGAVYPKGE